MDDRAEGRGSAWNSLFAYVARPQGHDHVHRHAKDKGVPYEFSSAGQLLSDFYGEVDKVLKEIS